ncbi:MAG: hypothetical protein DMG08_27665 [Acidobacteria bacterium]|nr:MAG: hypothetical protein DMG08_27665 [Acidobacteriota bacterium]
MKKAFQMLFLIAWSSVLLPVLAAQQPGVVRGTVEDPSGAPVAAASVKLTAKATGTELKAVTDEKGKFVFPEVPPGKYVLRVKMEGFQKAEVPIEVGATPTAPQRVRLALANVEDEITVSARVASDPLSSDENTSSAVIDHDLLTDLPAKKDDPLATANLFVDPAANDAVGTKIVVDGVESDSLEIPGGRSIKNIAVNRNPYSTEFGRPAKGRIEIATRGGGRSRLHKRFEYSIRDASMAARNPFATINPPRRREWFDGELDGPLFGDRATFFLGGDALRDNDNEFVTGITPSGPVSDTIRVPRRTGHVLGRTDIRLSPLNILSVRYNWMVDRWANQGVRGFDLASRAWASNKQAQELRVAYTATPTSVFLNQFVFDFKHRPKFVSSGTDAPAILVDGAFNSGGAQISRSDTENAVEFQDLASYIHGKHSLRFGAVVKSRFTDYADRSNFGGTFAFSNLASFVNNQPFLYTVNQGNPRVKLNRYEIASFFQDEIRLWPRLSLLLGLRHEFQSDLNVYNNLAPRIALATSTADGKTVLRVGSGIFYQRQPVSLEQQYLLHDGAHLNQVVLSNPSFPSPQILPNSLPSVFRIDPRIRAPYAIQASLGVERKLAAQTSLTAEYTMLRGVKLYRMRDVNAPLPATGLRPDPTLVNVDQFESSGTSNSHGVTLGFQTTLRKLQLLSRYTFSHSIDDTSGMNALPADNFALRGERGRSDFDQRHRLVVSGVMKLPFGSKLGMISTVRSGAPYNITTGFDTNNDTVANDRPSLANPNAPFNSFGIDGSFVGGIPGVLYNGLQGVSGGALIPINANSVRWLVLPGTGNVARNIGHGPFWADVDVRLTKKVILRKAAEKTETTRQVEFRFDVFNLLNQTNYKNYVGVLTSKFFGAPNTAHPARELQVGVRVSF